MPRTASSAAFTVSLPEAMTRPSFVEMPSFALPVTFRAPAPAIVRSLAEAIAATGVASSATSYEEPSATALVVPSASDSTTSSALSTAIPVPSAWVIEALSRTSTTFASSGASTTSCPSASDPETRYTPAAFTVTVEPSTATSELLELEPESARVIVCSVEASQVVSSAE